MPVGKIRVVKYIDTIVGPLESHPVPQDTSEIPNKILCKRCGRVLKDLKSQEIGFGSTCYKKYLAEKPQQIPLFQKPSDSDEVS